MDKCITCRYNTNDYICHPKCSGCDGHSHYERGKFVMKNLNERDTTKEQKRKYEIASLEASAFKKWWLEEAGKRVDAEKEIKEKSVYIDVLEDENEQLRKERDELEAQMLELAQSQIAVDYGPMTDSAGKGVL